MRGKLSLATIVEIRRLNTRLFSESIFQSPELLFQFKLIDADPVDILELPLTLQSTIPCALQEVLLSHDSDRVISVWPSVKKDPLLS